MLIEIPDEIIDLEIRDAFSKMKPMSEKCYDIHLVYSPLLHEVLRVYSQMGVVPVRVSQAILKEAINRGVIVYNSDAGKWQGVDYDAD